MTKPNIPVDLAEARRLAGGNVGPLAGAMMERMADEIADLRISVIAFCAPAAAKFARDHALPKNHLYPTHYDILKRAGARMDSFARWEG